MKKYLILILLTLGFLSPSQVNAQNKTPILGPSTTTVYQMQEWAIAEEADPIFVELGPLFYEIALEYEIDPAVIYAQSAKETNFMRFTGVLDASFHNPCGLKTTSGGSNSDPNAHARFTSWKEGITAMAHHLALYAGHEDFPMEDTPDPRHFPSIYNTASTVEELGGKWAPSADYGNDIVRRMIHLYSMPTQPVFRLAGSDRYDTSAKVANYTNRLTRNVLIANGDKASDALVAAPLARYLDASILLTRHGKLPESVFNELKKNQASQVILLGGTGSVSEDIEKSLIDNKLKVERISGNERYETSVRIQKYLEEKSKKSSDHAILASGITFADALAIAPYAAKEQYPILLTNGKTLTVEVRAQLAKMKSVTIVGGTATISRAIEEEIAGYGVEVTRISGANRYQTAHQIALRYFPDAVNFYMANGMTFPDALVGAPLAAKYNAPILLVETDRIPPVIKEYLYKKEIERIAVLGGTGSISDTVFSELEALQ